MIFCVEDDNNIRELVVYTLETTGFKARGFEDGSRFLETLYFCPLSSRSLYSVPAAALRDRSIPEEGLAGLVETVAEKGASDGLAADAEGTVYAGDYESGSIRAISTDGG